MDKEQIEQKASLKISRDVIKTIARVAALETKGVASLGEPHGNVEGLFKNRFAAQQIEVSITNGVAEISLFLNLELGARIPEVCTTVQRSVKENVQTMTGIVVNRVNINVVGVELPELRGDDTKPSEIKTVEVQ